MPESEHPDLAIPAGEHLGGSSPENDTAPKWFAIYTAPRHEKRVDHYLNQREIEHFLPLYRVRHKWRNGVTAALELPLFPGYLFVRINRNQRVKVLEVPGVLTVVGGTGHQPAPLPDEEIDALRIGLPLRNAEPHPLLTAGQRARICSGPLAGMVGVVVRNKNGLRVVLTMDLIMRSVSVEVDASELEPVDSEPSHSTGSGRPSSADHAARPFRAGKNPFS